MKWFFFWKFCFGLFFVGCRVMGGGVGGVNVFVCGLGIVCCVCVCVCVFKFVWKVLWVCVLWLERCLFDFCLSCGLGLEVKGEV